MQLQSVLDSLETLPEDLHENYEQTEQDGKTVFKLKLVQGLVPEKDADTFEELRGALTKERNDLKTLKDQNRELVTTIETLGGVDTLKELVQSQKDAEKSNLEKKGEYEALLNQVREEHASEMSKKDATIQGLRSKLDREIRGRQVMEAITELEGNPNLLQTTVMQAARLIGDEDSDELSVQVYDPDTDIMLVDGEGKPLSVKGYVERLRQDERFAPAFKGTGNSGSGAPADGDGDSATPGGGGDGGTGGGIPTDLANFRRSQATPRQRIDVIRKLQEQAKGDYNAAEEAYLNLPW